MANKKAMEVFKMERALKFGVEMEIADLGTDIQAFINEVEANGVKMVRVGVDHSTKSYWKIGYDSSISGNRPCEIVSPPLKNFDDLEVICSLLAKYNAKVNKTCGLHVHHDSKGFEAPQHFKNLINLWAKHEEGIFSVLPMSRHNNQYAKKVAGDLQDRVNNIDDMATMQRVIMGKGEGHYTQKRYYQINLASYVRQGTIEFRGHSGTTDFEKIKYWVLLTNRIMEMALLKKEIKPKTQIQIEREANNGITAVARHMNIDFDIGGTDIAYYLRKRRKALKA